jgi:hypothetical protein
VSIKWLAEDDGLNNEESTMKLMKDVKYQEFVTIIGFKLGNEFVALIC